MRSTPNLAFMCQEYRKLIERLTADAEKYGVRETSPGFVNRYNNPDCTDTPFSRKLKFTQIVRDFYNKHAYSYGFGMSSGSRALAFIESELSKSINYPAQ